MDGKKVRGFLDQLDDKFRLPLVLLFFEDRSYRDIADTLRLPIGTVMSRLARGKQKLRDQLNEELASVIAERSKGMTRD